MTRIPATDDELMCFRMLQAAYFDLSCKAGCRTSNRTESACRIAEHVHSSATHAGPRARWGALAWCSFGRGQYAVVALSLLQCLQVVNLGRPVREVLKWLGFHCRGCPGMLSRATRQSLPHTDEATTSCQFANNGPADHWWYGTYQWRRWRC